MDKKVQKQAENTSLDLFQSSRLSIFLQVSAYTVAIMAILGGMGYFLDSKLGTSPTIFIVSLVIAYPALQVMIYRKFKKFGNDKINHNK